MEDLVSLYIDRGSDGTDSYCYSSMRGPSSLVSINARMTRVQVRKKDEIGPAMKPANLQFLKQGFQIWTTKSCHPQVGWSRRMAQVAPQPAMSEESGGWPTSQLTHTTVHSFHVREIGPSSAS